MVSWDTDSRERALNPIAGCKRNFSRYKPITSIPLIKFDELSYRGCGRGLEFRAYCR